MIIETKIEVDWLEEDGSIDDAIRESIVAGVIRTVQKDISAKIEARVTEEITNRVDALTDSLWKDFMEKRVTITDKYGDPVESHDSIKDMLKAKLDHFLNQRVDRDGKPYPNNKECPYGSKPRVEWLMDWRINEHTTNFVKTVQNDFDIRLKSALNEKLKASLSASMLKNIDLNKAISAAS